MKYIKKLLKVVIIIISIILLIAVIDYGRIIIRYKIKMSNYQEAFNVYGNKDGYVPQGLTYSDKYNIVLQTSYSKEVSKVFIINFKTGKLIKELKLLNKDLSNNNKHVGGIAVHNDTVWISNNDEVDIYNLEKMMSTNEDTITAEEEIKLSIRGDFCYFNNNTLWIGDFYLKPFYNVPNGDPKLYGYKYSSNINYDKPDYVLSLPKAVQGMVVLPDNKVAFSQSFTYLVNSNLSIYDNILNTNNEKFNKTNKVKTIKIPPMAEGMFYKDGYLYILFESSTENYSMAYPKLNKVLKMEIKNLY